MSQTKSRDRRGFALLITITLLAFLVLLLVSLATLTRVETQLASNTQSLERARQNALMALNVAVGQLQKYAGPDNRATAVSGVFTTYAAKPNLTGVWDSNTPTIRLPSMWLVSGSETETSVTTLMNSVPDPSVDIVAPATDENVFLVGDRSVATKAQRIKLAKREITAAPGTVPGFGASETPVTGHYAWWVGDQGVKASLGLTEREDRLDYGPWADEAARHRVRRQIGAGANYFRKTGATNYGFDPLDTTSRAALERVYLDNQLAFVPSVTGGDLGDYRREHFHDFTAASHSVLANSVASTEAHRGLLRDLSVAPEALGVAFKNYANYTSYMEAPVAGDLRRRYRIKSYSVGKGAAAGLPTVGFNVAPIVSDLLLRIRVARLDDNSVVVRSKLFVSLWNPYTSALVPEDLYLEISGLPKLKLWDSSKDAATGVEFALSGADTLPTALRKAGDPSVIRVKLAFDTSAANGSTEDKSSWLPGRVYSWATTGQNTTLSFYTQDSQATDATGWRYVNVPQIDGTAGISLSAPATTAFKARLVNAAGEELGVSDPSLSGGSYPTLNIGPTDNGWKFGYGFRIRQPATNTKTRLWWTRAMDMRINAPMLGFDFYREFDPAEYSDPVNPANMTHHLIHRSMAGNDALSSSNDVAMFELPRQPLLSVGELQQLILPQARIFSIGNSWGTTSTTDANSLFDRFFFSGLATGVPDPDFNSGQPLPNWNLRLAKNIDATALRAEGEYTSRDLLQAGGFNVNSASVAAWRAVLSGNRFDPGATLDYLKTTAAKGGTGDTTESEPFDRDSTLGANVPAPLFFRFPQSAEETWDWTNLASRDLSTQPFRKGVRGGGSAAVVNGLHALSTDDIENLAAKIVARVKAKAVASGPFRSLSDFLKPNSVFGGNGNLLEAAINDAGLNPKEIAATENVQNVTEPGFSSLTLTSADIMTALAPYAKARSDTFLVRTYGDAVNPATGETDGRAYLEATVQRLPVPVAAADQATVAAYAQPSGVFGRQFKIISFRWLTASDI